MNAKNTANHIIFLKNLSDRLVWLEVKRNAEKLQILDAGVEPFFDRESTEEHTLPAETPLDILKETITAIYQKTKSGWFTKKEVIYVAPSHRLTARFLETPPTNMENIEELVAFEVSEALQIPIESIAWDIILSSRHEETDVKHLLWLATRKEYIDGLLAAWPHETLIPNRITCDFWSYYEYLLTTDPAALQNLSLLVSLEGYRATISVVNHKAIYFTRTVTLARRIQAEPAIDEKLEHRLAVEIQRTLSYVAERANDIQNMILCGFDQWNADSLHEIANRYGYSISMLSIQDFEDCMEGHTAALSSDHLSLLCMTHCRMNSGITGPSLLDAEEEGLTLGSLVPEAAIPSQKFMVSAAVLLGLLLTIWITQSLWFHGAVSKRLDEGDVLLKLSDHLRKEETALRTLAKTHMDYDDVFLFLAETLPEGILVNSITLDQRSGIDLVLKGGNHKKITEFIDKLNQSKYFRNIIESRAVNERDGFTVYLKGKLSISA